MFEVARWPAGLKAGAGAPPPAAADGLDPVRSPVCWLCKRSVEDRARRRALSSARNGQDQPAGSNGRRTQHSWRSRSAPLDGARDGASIQL